MVTLSARSRAFLSGYGLGIGGALLALVLGLIAALAMFALGAVGAQVSTEARIVVLLVFGQYVPFMGFPLAYLSVYRGFSWSDVRSYLGVRVPSLKELGFVVGGLFSVFALVLGMSIVVQLVGVTPAENNASQVAQQSDSLALLLVVASLVVIGPCEETLFRGTVQNRLREEFSAPTAITLTAVLFAAVHVTALTGGAGARAVTIGVLLVPSFVFGITYELTDNLVVPTLIHGTWNAMLFSLILLGGQVAETSVVLPL
ncbi:lysostaphin resistance A-like protein [Halobaculum sp. MBLA0143]|uniref:lysostaphin resistance A-like protein n=1 Tax=Halobaculum sp. MBLA0143 TaxID=3079933 RepID=UPI0035258B29